MANLGLSIAQILMCGAGVLGFVALLLLRWVLSLRVVVKTSEVHVVQRAGETITYGKAAANNKGNVYYRFPSWLPIIGVTVTILPTGIFDRDLKDYEAYDKDRLPFMVDVKTFFRIKDFDEASVKVTNTRELEEQLDGIVQGAVRSLLAKEDLESIMSERNKYGQQFTAEVAPQLKEWGVETVKNIELMDIVIREIRRLFKILWLRKNHRLKWNHVLRLLRTLRRLTKLKSKLIKRLPLNNKTLKSPWA